MGVGRGRRVPGECPLPLSLAGVGSVEEGTWDLGTGNPPAHLCLCTKEVFQQLFIDRSLEPRGGDRGGRERRRDLCPTSPDLAWVTLGLVWAQQPQPLASLEAG